MAKNKGGKGIESDRGGKGVVASFSDKMTFRQRTCGH